MNRVLIIILLSLLFCKAGFAESYYFKECKIDEKYLANYIIDFDKDIIKVNFTGTDGTSQEWTDKIEVIAKDRITSKIIQSKKNKIIKNSVVVCCPPCANIPCGIK